MSTNMTDSERIEQLESQVKDLRYVVQNLISSMYNLSQTSDSKVTFDFELISELSILKAEL